MTTHTSTILILAEHQIVSKVAVHIPRTHQLVHYTLVYLLSVQDSRETMPVLYDDHSIEEAVLVQLGYPLDRLLHLKSHVIRCH